MKNIFNLLFVMLIAAMTGLKWKPRISNLNRCLKNIMQHSGNIKKVITPSHSDGSEAGHRKGQPRYTTV